MTAPAPDELEVTVFGPGYGESSVVHVGDGMWAIIDSCVDTNTGLPAPLQYLREIGVDLARDVKLLVASHWHDDHIRGMARVASACATAKFCCSSALSRQEFLATVVPYAERNMITAGSGVNEIFEVLKQIAQSSGSKTVVRASPNRRVFAIPPGTMRHGLGCEVWTLSPSDGQFRKFLEEIAKLVPMLGETKHRVPDQAPNHLAVVTWIQIGPVSMLFGSDLEETGDDETGWSVIVASAERPVGNAIIFKVPHHGSETGHNDAVWSEMLSSSPYAVLTPYNRGTKLPGAKDVARILERTPNAFSTARLMPRKKSRPVAVEKEIKLSARRLEPLQQNTGAVRLRNGGRANPNDWRVELLHGACRLQEF